jgi:hypothetical protein
VSNQRAWRPNADSKLRCQISVSANVRKAVLDIVDDQEGLTENSCDFLSRRDITIVTELVPNFTLCHAETRNVMERCLGGSPFCDAVFIVIALYVST